MVEISKKSFIISIILSFSFCIGDYSFLNSSNHLNRSDLKGLIGIMIDFKENQNPLTSGNGKFLDSLNVGFIQDRSIARCDYENHFIVENIPTKVLFTFS